MKKRKIKISIIRIFRMVTQIVFFILLPALFVSTFSGIKQIYLSIIDHSFNISELFPQVIEALAIIPVTILIGRFFCSWMCAFGAMGDFIYLLSQKILRKKIKINEKMDRILKFTKYGLLLFLIIAVWSLGLKLFEAANPWDAFGMLFTVGQSSDFGFVMANLLPAFIILTSVIIGSFFVERFFCRYLCPLGAFFSIVSKVRITRFQKNREKCGNCRICTKSCPMGIRLYEKDTVKSGECINCFECVSACPRKNVSFEVNQVGLKPLIAGTMAVAVMTGVYYTGNFAANAQAKSLPAYGSVSSANESPQTQTSVPGGNLATNPTTKPTVAPTASPTNKFKDGTFQGSGSGYRGTVTVSVVIKNGIITDVLEVSFRDDSKYFDRAWFKIAPLVISAQSSNVSTVSGATYSSKGIIQAVDNALTSALY